MEDTLSSLLRAGTGGGDLQSYTFYSRPCHALVFNPVS
jgi:hypothetical protein